MANTSEQLTLKSSTQKHKPFYKLKVLYEAPSGQKWEDKEIQGTFMEWFNVHGFLQKKDLQLWLGKNIEVIGMADPTSQKVAEKQYEDIVDDTVTMASASATETPATAAKTRKPRKKA